MFLQLLQPCYSSVVWTFTEGERVDESFDISFKPQFLRTVTSRKHSANLLSWAEVSCSHDGSGWAASRSECGGEKWLCLPTGSVVFVLAQCVQCALVLGMCVPRCGWEECVTLTTRVSPHRPRSNSSRCMPLFNCQRCRRLHKLGAGGKWERKKHTDILSDWSAKCFYCGWYNTRNIKMIQSRTDLSTDECRHLGWTCLHACKCVCFFSAVTCLRLIVCCKHLQL